MNYLDRNEFNFEPSQLVVDTIKNFDIRKFAFYTRIYDQGKKSIFSVYLSEQFHIDEQQVLLGYGAEDLLKKAVHYFLTVKGSNGIMMIPKFSWWYYSNIADEVEGQTIQYNVIETDDTFKYDFEALERQVNEVRPKILLVATPNNPTGNGLTPAELEHLCDIVPAETVILVDEAYASYVTSDTTYIKHLVETRGNIIFCRTMSKFYGLPGLRLGFGFIVFRSIVVNGFDFEPHSRTEVNNIRLPLRHGLIQPFHRLALIHSRLIVVAKHRAGH